MLKIKDNVDLKELEKYGFSTMSLYGWYEKNICYDLNDRLDIYVNKKTRIIQVSTYDGYDVNLDDTLYDLIKANLVEKVGDE